MNGIDINTKIKVEKYERRDKILEKVVIIVFNEIEDGLEKKEV